MKLKFVDPKALDKNLKATVHKSGKLGFTVEAAKKLALSETKSAGIAQNEDDPTDTSLYMLINPGITEDAFRIHKAGDYYYLNTRAFFESIQVDFENETTVYDIQQIEIEGQEYFKFRKRPSKKPKRPVQSSGS